MNHLLIHNRLSHWYEQNHRVLPWRETTDPYCIWVSEVILQQTRVNQGLEYYLRFINRFPDVQSLAQAPEEEVLRYWQGLGYYSRARNMHRAAQMIVASQMLVFTPKATQQAKEVEPWLAVQFLERRYAIENELIEMKRKIEEEKRKQIELEENYSSYDALKSFSDWYKLVYGGSISYAQVHAELVVSSSSVEPFQQKLLDYGVVPSKMDGPVQNSINNTNSSMLPNYQFVLITGVVGVIVAVLGIYYDSFGVFSRRFKRFSC